MLNGKNEMIYTIEITGSFKVKVTSDQQNEPDPAHIEVFVPDYKDGIEQLPGILTVKQVANYIGLHQNTVYLRCTTGELKSFKSGNSRRIRKTDLIEWMSKLEN